MRIRAYSSTGRSFVVPYKNSPVPTRTGIRSGSCFQAFQGRGSSSGGHARTPPLSLPCTMGNACMYTRRGSAACALLSARQDAASESCSRPVADRQHGSTNTPSKADLKAHTRVAGAAASGPYTCLLMENAATTSCPGAHSQTCLPIYLSLGRWAAGPLGRCGMRLPRRWETAPGVMLHKLCERMTIARAKVGHGPWNCTGVLSTVYQPDMNRGQRAVCCVR